MVTPLLEVTGLSVSAPNRPLLLDSISFQLAEGQRIGLIGASGSGKSMTAATLCGLLRPPLRVLGGSIRLKGVELTSKRAKIWRSLRGNSIFQIFQSPGTALSPASTIGWQLKEAASRAGRESHSSVVQSLDAVRLPISVLENYPYQLSGGMKQRILIAMALILRPAILIADEPTTGLDILTEKDVLDALNTMIDETGAALLFISHDLRAVRRVAGQILFLSEGRIVEDLQLTDIGLSRVERVRELVDAARELGLSC